MKRYNVVVTITDENGEKRRHIVRKGLDAEKAERIRESWERRYREKGADRAVTVEAA